MLLKVTFIIKFGMRSFLPRVATFLALSLSLVFACDSEEATTTPGGDAAIADASVGDSTSDPTRDANADGGVVASDASPDGSLADAAADASADAAIAPTVVAVSATGHDRFFGVTYDPQGNIFAVGVLSSGTDAADDLRTVVAKFSGAGVLDTTFGNSGYAVLNVVPGGGGEVMRGIVVQSTGKIVVAGTVEHTAPQADGGAADARDRDVALVRFNANGTPDTTFGTAATGVVLLDLSDGEAAGSTYLADTQWGLALGAGDKLVVSGAVRGTGPSVDGGVRADTDFAVVRLEANGARDNTFDGDGVATLDIGNLSASPRSVTVLGDGSVVMSGYMRDANSIVSPVVFKLTAAGILDTTFGVGGIYNEVVLQSVTEVYGTAPQGNNFVTAGYGRNGSSESTDWVSLRILGDGGRDLTYGPDGGHARIDVAGETDNARAVTVLPDGRVVIVGGGRLAAANSDGMIAMLTPGGLPDTTFGPGGYRLYDLGGTADFFWAAAVAPDGKHFASVGVAGAPVSGDDDAVLLVLPTGL